METAYLGNSQNKYNGEMDLIASPNTTSVTALAESAYIPKREITIAPLDRGYVVRVGCQSIAIEDVETLVEKLSEYLRDPKTTETKYNEKTLFKKQ